MQSHLLSNYITSRFIFTRSEIANKVLANSFLVVCGVVYIAALAQISIYTPITPVPFTFQTFAFFSSAMVLGSKRSLATSATYISLGTLGMPIFAAGRAGFTGASFGFLFGMAIAGAMLGYFAERKYDRSFAKTAALLVLANVINYVFGTTFLMIFLNISDLSKALTLAVIPFLIGDFLKAALVVGIHPTLWKLIAKFTK